MATSDENSQAARIIKTCGGVMKLTRMLGYRHPSVVQRWLERGFIPTRKQPDVLKAARHEGIELSPGDFFGEATNGFSGDGAGD